MTIEELTAELDIVFVDIESKTKALKAEIETMCIELDKKITCGDLPDYLTEALVKNFLTRFEGIL